MLSFYESIGFFAVNIVANSMFDVFTNEKFVENMMKENGSIVEKIAGKVKEILTTIKSAIKMLGISNTEIGALVNDVEKLEHINTTFNSLLEKAGEKYKVEHGAGQKNNTDQTANGVKFSYKGKAEDGRSIYKTNYAKGTPKSVKQQDLIDLVQNIWSKKPITLTVIRNGKQEQIVANFNPELTERSDLSKMAFGNRKGNASDQRITLDLASDFYQIAEESKYVKSKDETGKDNPAHDGVFNWEYFITNLVYRDENDVDHDYHMNIDVKEKADGHYFYSFGIEKGTAPQTLLAVVTDESATVPIDIISNESETVKKKFSYKSEHESGQKNNTAEAVKSSGIKFSVKASYDSKMQNTIDGYLESVDSNLLQFISETKKGANKQNSKYYFGNVSDRVAKSIYSLLGIDTSGWKIAIEAKSIAHILKDHGENGITDKSMSNDNDIARMKFVFENYDEVIAAGTTNAYKERKDNGFNKNAPTVKYSKRVNGVYYVVQAVPNTKAKTLYIVTGYLTNEIGTKKEALQFSESEINSASEQTSKNANANTSINIISNESESVKEKLSHKDTSPIQAHWAETIRENHHFRNIMSLIDEMQLGESKIQLNSRDIERIARELIKSASSKYDQKEFADKLIVVYDYMANSGKNADTEEIYKSLLTVANGILEQSEMKDTELYDQYKNVRDYLRNQPIYITPQVKKETVIKNGLAHII